MTYYHGSPVENLTELKPFLSEHDRPYIYFATNPLVALLYAVKPVPKPFSFYPYGFTKEGILVYSEYFENAFAKIYTGKKGYLYSCNDLQNTETPTEINCAYTCTEPVKIDDVLEIADLYAFYKEQEKKGTFIIKPCQEISEREMTFALSELKKDVNKFDLKNDPEHPMSIFIKTNFASVWNPF